MTRALVTALVLSLLLAGRALADPQWEPAAWTNEDTLKLTTDVADEGSYTFPVWLVVVDGAVYVRLGTRAADRVQKSRSAPFVGVTVAGQHFDHVRCLEDAAKAPAVAQAIAAKYWSDLFIHWMAHPLTCRLQPE